jgi:hypothetical protein
MIVASVKGFSEGHQYSDLKVYENVAQCAGGAASTTGFWDGPPTVSAAALGDSNTGMHLAIGILTALIGRDKTGKGQKVAVSMQDAVLNLCRVKLRDQQRLERVGYLEEYPQYPHGTFTDVVPRGGNAGGGGQPGWVLKCKGWEADPNAYIYFTIQGHAWEPICRAIGRPQWVNDPDYKTAEARQPHIFDIFAKIEEWLADKIYIYGYLNRVQSSRRLERECQRNVELMWLTGRLAPDFKTIADFRRDNGTGIRNVCRRFVVLCRELKLFSQALVAIDGSKFKAVNTRDRNFTEGKVDKRQKQIEESIQRYLNALETADRTQPAELEAKTSRLQDKIARLREQMRNLDQIKEQLKTQPDGQLSMTDPDACSMATSGKGSGMVGYNVQVETPNTTSLLLARSQILVVTGRSLVLLRKLRAMPWVGPGCGQSPIVATLVGLRSRSARMPGLQ